MPPDTDSRLPKFFIVIFSAITGFVLTFLLLNINYRDYEELPKQARLCTISNKCVTLTIKQTYQLPDSLGKTVPIPINQRGKILFHYNPSFLVWTMLIILMMTISSGALPVFIEYIKSIRKAFSINLKTVYRIIAFTVVSAAIMVVLPLSLRGYYTPFWIVTDMKILFENSSVILILSIGSIILSLPMIATMFLVGKAGDSIPASTSDPASAKQAVENFNYLNSVLLAALQVLATIVVLSGLCSAALGESIKSTFTIVGFDIFPKELSYAYGLFYALFLAIFYLPVYFSLKEKGKLLQQALVVAGPGQDEKEAEKNKQLGEKLELKSSALDSFKLALTILSPLIASFIPEHLQLFK